MHNYFKQWQFKKSGKNGEKLLQSNAKKVFSKIRFVKTRQLTDAAHQLHEQFFSQFSCLDCANCCKSIPPIVNETDAARIARFLRMKSTEFKEQYLRFDEDGDPVMKSSPCPFLDQSNHCLIYEVRPKACREYPHTDAGDFERHINTHIANAAHCPAAAYVIDELEVRFGKT
jgi:hypothetical protein